MLKSHQRGFPAEYAPLFPEPQTWGPLRISYTCSRPEEDSLRIRGHTSLMPLGGPVSCKNYGKQPFHRPRDRFGAIFSRLLRPPNKAELFVIRVFDFSALK